MNESAPCVLMRNVSHERYAQREVVLGLLAPRPSDVDERKDGVSNGDALHLALGQDGLGRRRVEHACVNKGVSLGRQLLSRESLTTLQDEGEAGLSMSLSFTAS